MAVDGNWNIVMTTPMGERKATLTLKNAGGTLTGTQGADGNSGEIFDGTTSGDDVAWKISITNPMPLTLAFTGRFPATACPAKWASARWAVSRSRERGPDPRSLQKLILLSIAAVAALVTAAFAQTAVARPHGAHARLPPPWFKPAGGRPRGHWRQAPCRGSADQAFPYRVARGNHQTRA